MTIKTNGMATVHSAFPWQALPKFPETHTEHFQGIIVQGQKVSTFPLLLSKFLFTSANSQYIYSNLTYRQIK